MGGDLDSSPLAASSHEAQERQWAAASDSAPQYSEMRRTAAEIVRKVLRTSVREKRGLERRS